MINHSCIINLLKFAYNEASFMLVRLLQKFDGITLDKSAQPSESIPREYWRNMPGRQAKEEIVPKSHLTTYAHVSAFLSFRLFVRANLWYRRVCGSECTKPTVFECSLEAYEI
jgi:hypothetical protein